MNTVDEILRDRAREFDDLQKSMEALGVSICDTYGSLKSLDEFLSELNKVMEDMTEKEDGD